MKPHIPDQYLPEFILCILVMSALLIWVHNSRYRHLLYTELKWFKKSKPVSSKGGARVSFTDSGRSGYVMYERAGSKFQLYWEFAGGNAVASIAIPQAAEWVAQTGIPLEQRAAVLDDIGRQVVAQKTTGGRGSFKIEGDWIVIYAPPQQHR